jgi:hypothetical protein
LKYGSKVKPDGTVGSGFAGSFRQTVSMWGETPLGIGRSIV